MVWQMSTKRGGRLEGRGGVLPELEHSARVHETNDYESEILLEIIL